VAATASDWQFETSSLVLAVRTILVTVTKSRFRYRREALSYPYPRTVGIQWAGSFIDR
jgi:hypothetical protein